MASSTKITFCRICEASCGLRAQVDGEQVLKLAPDPDHVVSRGFACIKGTRYTEVHGSPDRVLAPLKRVGERFEQVSWEQALSEIGERVRALRAAHGDDSVGLYMGNPAAFSPAHTLSAGSFRAGLKTRQFYTSGSQDCNNKFVVAEEMFGSPLLQPIPDLDRTTCAIFVGSNPVVSQLSFANLPRIVERLKAVTRRDPGRVVFVDPRRTESARVVGEHLSIRPGSDVFFLLAFAHEVFAQERVQHGVDVQVEGLGALREVVAPWSPERVAALTGIAAAPLRQLVSDYCSADGAVLYAGTGVNQGPHGTLAVWLVVAIQVLSGQLDRPGAMIVTRQQQRTARLAAPSGEHIVHTTSRLSAHRSVLDSLPAGLLADEIRTPGPGQLRALFVTAGNPVLSCPNSERLQGALRDLSLLVSIDLFRNETGNLAHYILPATSFLERSDVPLGMAGFQPVPYAQYVEPVVAPRGEARDEWWIFAHLGRVCAAPLRGSRLFQWWLDLSVRARGWRLPRFLRFSPELLFTSMAWLEGLSFRSLRKAPHGRLLPANTRSEFVRKGALTPSRKLRLAPARFVAAAAALEADFQAQLEARSRVLLITKRERASHNSWMHNVPSLGGVDRSTNYLYVHPDDAAARAIVDGETCELRSHTSNLQVPVRISDDVAPGTVALPHGWGHAQADGLRVAQAAPGINANALSADGAQALETLSGMTRLTALEVELRKI